MSVAAADSADVTLVRSFVALPVPEHVRNALADMQRRLAGHFPQARWTRPETLHLTLCFFGDQPEEALDKIAEIMLSVGARFAPFAVRSTGIGAFPRERWARGFWLGLEASPALLDLQRTLLAGWRQAGIVIASGTFSPHLTLGRLRHPQPVAAEFFASSASTAVVSWQVKRLVLYESRLQTTGAEHLSRRVALLGG